MLKKWRTNIKQGDTPPSNAKSMIKILTLTLLALTHKRQVALWHNFYWKFPIFWYHYFWRWQQYGMLYRLCKHHFRGTFTKPCNSILGTVIYLSVILLNVVAPKIPVSCDEIALPPSVRVPFNELLHSKF